VEFTLFTPYNLSEIPCMVVLCQGIHNHPAPPPDKIPNSIKSELQLVIKNSIEQNDIVTAGSINSGNI